ncbi:M1 family metallopeptidase [Antarcticibacterium arcticum]|uniref:M1 family metallopeptidase n=1 Tax=Antarcticibacterium arcticum TaxID=2585771 RepID=A0A5B8YNL7_9FLAO|nr:M1 family metallopeptidase [Antarcticibacterium arcticum]QED38447.1 M1 family metallopeptidase [Antarcticibacterium arcticum]
MKIYFLALALLTLGFSSAQNNTTYWQQHVDYKMEVDMNVKNFRYTGTQELVYTNNSPDTLNRVFYHLYFNAFKPGSEMDIRSRTIEDPDTRVGDRISKLTPEQQGFLRVSTLTQNGKTLKMQEVGTVLEVELNEAILPGEKATFKMEFQGQVPEQVRRSGRNSSEGVALSMSQWYPKLAEYDFEGWHADPYIGREFHGVWGDFDVKISIDKNYLIGSTGYLQNPNEIGFGYEDKGVKVKKPKGDKLTWHFVAPKVHDFTWAADPDYVHDTRVAKDGTVLHFIYKNNPAIKENWTNLQPKTEELLMFFNENIGPYPWDQYTVIQGGDGGMEYAMLTLITGERAFGSLVGVTSHELAHAWFQHLMATNESKHEWMDEGFTSYISTLAMDKVMGTNKEKPFEGNYRGYERLAKSGVEEPLSTHADRYKLNFAYGVAAYTKGSVFLSQLGYLIGEENLKKTLKRYYHDWKFKHPTPNDFLRVAEKVSGAELDWYLMDWAQTTNTIDYGIKNVAENNGKTTVTLERIGNMPMPLDIQVTYADGSREVVYIPLQMMRWNKPAEEGKQSKVAARWAWAHPTYELILEKPLSEISGITIDESGLMADINRENNTFSREKIVD